MHQTSFLSAVITGFVTWPIVSRCLGGCRSEHWPTKGCDCDDGEIRGGSNTLAARKLGPKFHDFIAF
eukprot:scaffold132410_cov46-Prasinocladus_malaysianus.AAC.1